MLLIAHTGRTVCQRHMLSAKMAIPASVLKCPAGKGRLSPAARPEGRWRRQRHQRPPTSAAGPARRARATEARRRRVRWPHDAFRHLSVRLRADQRCGLRHTTTAVECSNSVNVKVVKPAIMSIRPVTPR